MTRTAVNVTRYEPIFPYFTYGIFIGPMLEVLADFGGMRNHLPRPLDIFADGATSESAPPWPPSAC